MSASGLGSHLLSEAKQGQARVIPGWEAKDG